MESIHFHLDKTAKIVNWKVNEGNNVHQGNVIFEYVECGKDGEDLDPPAPRLKFKASKTGVIRKVLAPKGACVKKGTPLLALDPVENCTHPIVLYDMCGVCSQDLRKLNDTLPSSASVAMVHSVPGLKVSMEEAQILGKQDEQHLIKERKLVLLVDLDQTLIHTTNDNVPQNLEDVFHFQLVNHGGIWYHTRLRPGTRTFLKNISSLYQLHICTFGTRQYANHIAHFLDPQGTYFSDRILSRDECFSQNSKTANLKELFPRGDHMVCIIDDREDVWNYAKNLIHVKPYHFFRHTGDINAPPGLTKKDDDDKVGYEFPDDADKISSSSSSSNTNNNTELKSAQIEKPSTSTSLENNKQDEGPVANDDDCKDMVTTTTPTTTNEVEKKNDNQQENVTTEPSTTTTTLMEVDEAKRKEKQEEDERDDESDTTTSDVGNESDKLLTTETETEKEQTTEIEKDKDENNVSTTTTTTTIPMIVQEEEGEAKAETNNLNKNSGSETLEVIQVEEVEVEKVESNNLNKDSGTETFKTIEQNSTEVISSTTTTTVVESENGQTETSGGGNSAEQDATKIQKNNEENLDSIASVVSSDVKLRSTTPTELINENPEDKIIKVEDPDDYLLYLEEILKYIHQAYYDLYDEMLRKGETSVPDVKNVIPYVRKKVLKGTSIVFSGVIPTHVQLEKSKQYEVAVSLGAHVSSKIIPPPKPGSHSKSSEPPTTHVVAARAGTAKVNEARRYKGIHIVTPDWLWCCAERWTRVDENLFLLYKQNSSVKRFPPPHCSSPEQPSRSKDGDFSKRLGNADSTNIPGPSSSSQPSSSSDRQAAAAARKERTPSGRFMDTINPLLTFSMDEIESMDHEVDDIFKETDSSSSSDSGDIEEERKEPPRRKKLKSSHSIDLSEERITKSIDDEDEDDEEDDESSTTDEEDTETESENPLGNSVLGKRKRSPSPLRTETETEDEPLNARFRRGEPLPSDLDPSLLSDSDDDDDNELNDQDDDWMAEALEREFLDENSQE